MHALLGKESLSQYGPVLITHVEDGSTSLPQLTTISPNLSRLVNQLPLVVPKQMSLTIHIGKH